VGCVRPRDFTMEEYLMDISSVLLRIRWEKPDVVLNASGFIAEALEFVLPFNKTFKLVGRDDFGSHRTMFILPNKLHFDLPGGSIGELFESLSTYEAVDIVSENTIDAWVLADGTLTLVGAAAFEEIRVGEHDHSPYTDDLEYVLLLDRLVFLTIEQVRDVMEMRRPKS
jgi:hypothetical protein